MGKTEGQIKRTSGGNILLIIILIIFAAILAGAVITAPKYVSVLKTWSSNHAEIKAARDKLADVKKTNDELLEKKQEIMTVDDEIQSVRDETFELAAGLEQSIRDGKSHAKICYITLDDGPYSRGREFLKIFNKYDVKATFFLTTANGDHLPDQGDQSASSMYTEYLKYGHTIGNHTYSHNYSSGGIYDNASAFIKSVEKQSDFTEKATGGLRPDIVRFPGGAGMAGGLYDSITDELRSKGYGWIDWTLDSSDSWGQGNTSPEKILDQVKDAAKDQDIMVILFHEWSENSQKAMPEVIEYLDKHGYIFLPLFKDSIMVEK